MKLICPTEEVQEKPMPPFTIRKISILLPHPGRNLVPPLRQRLTLRPLAPNQPLNPTPMSIPLPTAALPPSSPFHPLSNPSNHTHTLLPPHRHFPHPIPWFGHDIHDFATFDDLIAWLEQVAGYSAAEDGSGLVGADAVAFEVEDDCLDCYGVGHWILCFGVVMNRTGSRLQ
ncbi:hypothetical protein BDU57DRAFT_257234 [Ampelomyces quisqualis]|uniref:Uncharacterized protein n=1 Tax=Ampelomyces quisqualis TaxID=50730 RepID=A0A6A5QT64_AMPQU|nr:hypothetical protein BDU57DRAFT_257234 [Ampelomyces quisqualis]